MSISLYGKKHKRPRKSKLFLFLSVIQLLEEKINSKGLPFLLKVFLDKRNNYMNMCFGKLGRDNKTLIPLDVNEQIEVDKISKEVDDVITYEYSQLLPCGWSANSVIELIPQLVAQGFPEWALIDQEYFVFIKELESDVDGYLNYAMKITLSSEGKLFLEKLKEHCSRRFRLTLTIPKVDLVVSLPELKLDKCEFTGKKIANQIQGDVSNIVGTYLLHLKKALAEHITTKASLVINDTPLTQEELQSFIYPCSRGETLCVDSGLAYLCALLDTVMLTHKNIDNLLPTLLLDDKSSKRVMGKILTRILHAEKTDESEK